MELQRLEKYKKEFSHFSGAINSVQQYLGNAQAQAIPQINPGSVANILSIPLYDLVFVFGLAEKEHLMKKTFQVFSLSQEFLGTFFSSDEIPEKIYNRNTGEDVEKDDFRINVIYELEK